MSTVSMMFLLPKTIATTIGMVQLIKKAGGIKNKKWYSVLAILLAGGMTSLTSMGVVPEEVINSLLAAAGSTLTYDVAHDIMKLANRKVAEEVGEEIDEPEAEEEVKE